MPAINQLAALPERVQQQLLRIARKAAGMSTAEKEYARAFLGSLVLYNLGIEDEGVEALTMVGACGEIVAMFDQASGDAASWLVVR